MKSSLRRNVLFDRRLVDVVEYSKRRELKINQYKKEKELKGRILEVTIDLVGPCASLHGDWQSSTIAFHRKFGRRGTNSNICQWRHWFRSHSFFLPSGPSPSSTKYEGEELDSDVLDGLDQVHRETILPPLHLLYAQSNTQLQNMKQELERPSLIQWIHTRLHEILKIQEISKEKKTKKCGSWIFLFLVVRMVKDHC